MAFIWQEDALQDAAVTAFHSVPAMQAMQQVCPTDNTIMRKVVAASWTVNPAWVFTDALQPGQVTCHIIRLGLQVWRELIVHMLQKILLEEGWQYTAPAGGSKCPALLHHHLQRSMILQRMESQSQAI